MGRIEATTITDHVVPHRGDMVLFWDQAMWQPACDWHHSVVKQRLEALWSQGLVTIDDLWLTSSKAIEIAREFEIEK